MNGKEFKHRLRRYAKAHGLSFEVDSSRGKGSHVMVKLGNRKTVVKSGEIGRGLWNAMLKQLGIDSEEF